MSVLIEVDQPATIESSPSVRPLDLPQAHAAQPVTSTVGDSPTTSIQKVLASLAIGITLATLLGANGIVHAGKGMDDGPARTVT
ncbi:MAG: hypothetical protein ACRDG4_17700, partial [Chloroflexota bacterium]